ncbi:MAG: hypothetical protein JWO84_322 [Parcubacteria group bacterium]|nr:hypothetical protein [Parcubacteria group bacterium]
MVVAVLTSGPLPFHLQKVDAASTHDLLVSYAAKDTDGDVLPDWEEALYGTDPNNPHSVSATVTDGQAVAQGLVKPKFASATTTPVSVASIPGTDSGPQTLTDQFARGLFSQYLSKQDPNNPPTPEAIATFVEGAVNDFVNSQQIPDAYNRGQVQVVGSGPDALLSYAASAENVFAAHTVATDRGELEYYADAVEKNDLTALAQVKKIGAAYTAIAKGYIAVPVPKEAATPHLAVANALARLGSDITDMSTMQSDPLRSYLGLAKYEIDAPAFVQAMTSLEGVYASEQVVVPSGTGGSSFYSAMVSASTVTTP